MRDIHMRYNRVIGSGSRGFRLKNPKKFSVQRLRAGFEYLFGRLSIQWRFSYGHALRLLKKALIFRNGVPRKYSSSSSSGRRSGGKSLGEGEGSRLRSFGRSNSFYSEAIADCLEFIKRSSVSVDQT